MQSCQSIQHIKVKKFKTYTYSEQVAADKKNKRMQVMNVNAMAERVPLGIDFPGSLRSPTIEKNLNTQTESPVNLN